jgi:membrane-associated phospholipid phosphatase
MAARWTIVAARRGCRGGALYPQCVLARRPAVPLYGVVLCAALFGLLLLLAYTSARVRHLDASALQGFVELPRGRSETLAERIAQFGDPGSVAIIAVLLAGVALLRGRPRIAAAVLLLVLATSVSSQLLKSLLEYPRDYALVAPSAFPSGHSTAAMTLAFCGVLVVPGSLRPLAALLGLAFAFGVALSVISLGWHYPSDVVGGYLLATGWTLAVVSGLLWLEQRRPERPGTVTVGMRTAVDRVAAVGLVTVALAGVALLALAVATVLITRRPDLGGFVERHTAAVVVAPLIVAAGAALLAAVTALLRRDQ